VTALETREVEGGGDGQAPGGKLLGHLKAMRARSLVPGLDGIDSVTLGK
jgi:hypothetical protein